MIRENYSNISTNWAKYVTLLAILFISHSCYKPKSTIATITVLNDSNNSPVSGATVRLFYDDPTGVNTSIINEQNTTSDEGVVNFDFSEYYKDGQAGFAVLDIEVNNVFVGVIQVEERATTEKTIYL
ncbi:MAG: hypothetical protein VXZ14_03530 [Bacteroidota bacterium]|nr:hypothetical protein [Bacteroidota bacterium]MEC7814214.1 hypothetical protein [Bacteroidota bacterium]MEC8004295.1 hypothetical protein [Bacteroidota bacterium]MEC8030739.1 hypothetical protein [Bacteroidota bacterium]MEC8407615.1 hypothetical protein [Bacteroidota bacterium]|tara:strand:- start:1695 stop:2075 length:381 start_codon:yes stop_codon:yes gene_type:complete